MGRDVAAKPLTLFRVTPYVNVHNNRGPGYPVRAERNLKGA